MASLTRDIYIAALRKYLKDFTEKNTILKFKEENDDEQLGFYLDMSIGLLNTVPPFIFRYNYSNFPIPPLLILQAVVECLVSNNIVQSRNDLQYNNGGITVKIDDRDRYLSIINGINQKLGMYMRSYESLKVQQNIENGWGGSYSPYTYISGDYQSLVPNTIF